MVKSRFKIEVRFQLCEDGKLLRIWSPDVPGFRLSHTDFDAVIGDVIPALSELLSERLGEHIRVYPLPHISELESNLDIPPIMPMREYVSEVGA